jgi:phage-related minor tail protein
MGQNEELISEINDLKRQKKNLKDESKKREMMKEAAIKLEEERMTIEKEYENTEKTLRQLKVEYEKKVKRRRDGLEA